MAPHRDFGVAIKVRLAVAATREPVGARNPAILYGVGNILENAVDFANQAVEVNAWWNADTIEIVISDDGPGIAPDMLKRIGEPYLSRRRTADDAQNERSGLGLGVFIARTLAGAHRRKSLLHQPDISRSRRRGAYRLAAQRVRGRRNRANETIT